MSEIVSWWKRRSLVYLPWLVLLVLAAVTLILWRPIWMLMTTPDSYALQAEVERLGPLAAVAFVALSIVQIVGAPIPGYPVQFLGGVLFGLGFGSLYGVIGMTAGGFIAAWLSRTLGRPFIEKRVSPVALAKYESLARLESLWVWVLILLLPIGDIPYFVAGLSRVKLGTLVTAILLSRGPFTVLIAWAGASATSAPSWAIGAMFVAILALVGLGYQFRNQLGGWIEKHVLSRVQDSRSEV